MLNLEEEFVAHLVDKDSFEYVLREGFDPSLLNAPLERSIYQFVKYHHGQSGQVPKLSVLKEEYPKYNFTLPETTIEYCVDKLKWRYKKNNLSDIVIELAQHVEDPDLAFEMLSGRMRDVEQATLSTQTVWSGDDYAMFLNDIQTSIVEGGYKGVTTGFPEVDKYTGGIRKGHAVYILARPKRQKTFTCLNAFLGMVKDGEEPYLSTLELTRDEIILRLGCMLTGYPWDKAQRGEMMPQDFKLFTTAFKDLREQYGQYWIEMPPLGERTVNALKLRADKVGAGPLIVSQFKYVNGSKDYYRNPFDESAEVAVDLKRAATAQGEERPILIEAQFNRGGDTMEELEDFDAGKVGLTDMIPQSADGLFGLFQNKDMRLNNNVEFGILEARNYGKAAWYVYYDYVGNTEFRLLPGSQH